jgi:hypothetical protein
MRLGSIASCQAVQSIAGRASTWVLVVVMAGGLLAAAPTVSAAGDPCPTGRHGLIQWPVACGKTVNMTDRKLYARRLQPGIATWDPQPAGEVAPGATDGWSAETALLLGGQFQYLITEDGPCTGYFNPNVACEDNHNLWHVRFDFANWNPAANVAQCNISRIGFEGYANPPFACSASYDNGMRGRVEMKIWRK